MNQFQDLLYRAGSEQGTRVLPGRPGGSLGITPLNKAWEKRKEAVIEWLRRDMQRPIPKPYHPRDNPYYIHGTDNWSFINQPSYRLAGNPSFDILKPWGPADEAAHKLKRASYAQTPEGKRLEEQMLKLRGALNFRGV